MYLCAVAAPVGTLNLSGYDNENHVLYTSRDNSSHLYVAVDNAYTIDGTRWAGGVSTDTFVLPYPLYGVSTVSSIYMVVDICPTEFGHFQTLFYDPTLGALFNPPNSPASSPGLSSGQVAVIATVIPVVVVLAVAIAVIWFVEPIHTKLLPSTSKGRPLNAGTSTR